MSELTFITIWAGIFGSIFGSFANVVIYRLPKNESVVKPRSRCPKCNSNIRWFDNIPVLGWLLLRGKCRDCKSPISIRYPMVELLMALVWAGLAAHVGFQWILVEYLVFSFGLLVISFIDFDHFIIPDVFSLGGIVVGLLGALLNPERQFLDALIGVLLGGGILWLIAILYSVIRHQEGLGGGDIKLLGWIGAVLGWQSIPYTIFLASILGSIIGIAMMTRSKSGLQTVLPFGPYLAFAALTFMFGGDQLARAYVQVFFPWAAP